MVKIAFAGENGVQPFPISYPLNCTYIHCQKGLGGVESASIIQFETAFAKNL